MSLEPDASLKRWGATFYGVWTGGSWSIEEQSWHINCLELWAAILAIQYFAQDKWSVTILLMINSTTAMVHVNNMGVTMSELLAQLAERSLDLVSSERHPSGSSTSPKVTECHCGHTESRALFDRTDWMIQPSVFRNIDRRTGQLEVDLFASRLTHLPPQFFSLKPDPIAIATDAFLQD